MISRAANFPCATTTSGAVSALPASNTNCAEDGRHSSSRIIVTTPD
jgi:hypothetical protein